MGKRREPLPEDRYPFPSPGKFELEHLYTVGVRFDPGFRLPGDDELFGTFQIERTGADASWYFNRNFSHNQRLDVAHTLWSRLKPPLRLLYVVGRVTAKLSEVTELVRRLSGTGLLRFDDARDLAVAVAKGRTILVAKLRQANPQLLADVDAFLQQRGDPPLA